MRFVESYLLLIVLPTAYMLALDAFVTGKQREFQARHPGKPYSFEEFRRQLSPLQRWGWVGGFVLLGLACIALRVFEPSA